MLPRGAEHPGGITVPAIRVGAGGHRPRRTSQLAPIRSCEHARGTTLRSRVVEGASEIQLRCRRKNLKKRRLLLACRTRTDFDARAHFQHLYSVAARAPSTAPSARSPSPTCVGA